MTLGGIADGGTYLCAPEGSVKHGWTPSGDYVLAPAPAGLRATFSVPVFMPRPEVLNWT
jgi:hypothetical protein